MEKPLNDIPDLPSSPAVRTSAGVSHADGAAVAAGSDVDKASGAPVFKSALKFTEVRDYAYPDFHPLHFGDASVLKSYEEEDAAYVDSEYENDAGNDQADKWPEDDEDSTASAATELSAATQDVDESDICGRAIALFDFVPENDNEAPLRVGQMIWVSYRHGQGWLVAQDPITGESGLVPEEYVQMIGPEQAGHTPPPPSLFINEHEHGDSEGWVDES